VVVVWLLKRGSGASRPSLDPLASSRACAGCPSKYWTPISTSSLRTPLQEVVVDARGHLLGRLASIVAKQLLSGNHVTLVRCEEVAISGGLTRQKMKYERFLAKAHNSNKKRCGPWHLR